MNFFKAFTYYDWSEKLFLLVGLILDKVYRLIPQYIFDVKNFTEKLALQGYSLSVDNRRNSLIVGDRRKSLRFILRKATSDFNVFDQIWIKEEFKEVLNLIEENSIDINNIVDAGANIGLVSIYFKDKFPNSKIVCIEPDASNIEQLKENININQLDGICFLEGGLWSHDGFMELDYSFRDGLEWSRRLTSSSDSVGNVPVFTLSNILEKYDLGCIDLLKIDIEGAEEEVFKHGADCEFLSRTKVITLEIHNLEKMGHKIINTLQEYGFSIHMSGELTIGIKEKVL